MPRAALFASGLALLMAAAPPPRDDPPAAESAAAKARRDRLHGIYLDEALGYTIYRDASRAEKVELRREPVYVWTNPIRGGEQDGEVFVWTCRGRAEVIGTFFSYPATGERNLNHELHALSTTTLDVAREGANTWTPQAPGLDLAPIPGAPAPGRTPAQRLSQMRALTRDFAAETEDEKGGRWDLRLLPQPLHRYESTDPDVLDGAVFAYVTSAGTDPEAILVIEARKPSDGGAPAWHYGLARFTDMNLAVKHRGRQVFSVPLFHYDAPRQDPMDRYRSFRDRGLPPVGEGPGAGGPP